MTVDELNTKLDAAIAKSKKIGEEEAKALALAVDLQKQIADLIAKGVQIPQETADKADALLAQLQIVDDQVQDATVPSP